MPLRPTHHRSSPRTSFLDDLKEKFEKTGQDTSFIDNFNKNSENPQRNRPNNRQQRHQQQFPQQQPKFPMNFNPHQMEMQMNFQPYNIVSQFDGFGNPMMAQSAMMNMNFLQNAPQPVPAPSQFIQMSIPNFVPEQQQPQPPGSGNNKPNVNVAKKVK